MSAHQGGAKERLVQRPIERDLEPVLLLTAVLVTLLVLAILLGSSSPGI
jgi:hypothetical protein